MLENIFEKTRFICRVEQKAEQKERKKKKIQDPRMICNVWKLKISY